MATSTSHRCESALGPARSGRDVFRRITMLLAPELAHLSGRVVVTVRLLARLLGGPDGLRVATGLRRGVIDASVGLAHAARAHPDLARRCARGERKREPKQQHPDNDLLASHGNLLPAGLLETRGAGPL